MTGVRGGRDRRKPGRGCVARRGARLAAVSWEGEEKEEKGCGQYALVIFANHWQRRLLSTVEHIRIMCALTFVGYFAGVYTAGRCMERCKKKERMKRRVRLKNWQIRRSDVIGVSVISVPVVVRLKNEIAPVSPRRYHRRQSWHIKQNDNFVLATRTI